MAANATTKVNLANSNSNKPSSATPLNKTTTNQQSQQPSKTNKEMLTSDISSSTTTPEAAPIIKKLPPIKAPVGLAKGPDLKNARSKIGSLENKEHKPGGGNLKVESRKLKWEAKSKVGSLNNVKHKPGGGNVKIFNEQYVEPKTAIKKQATNEDSTKNEESCKTATSHSNSNKVERQAINSLNTDLKNMMNLKD